MLGATAIQATATHNRGDDAKSYFGPTFMQWQTNDANANLLAIVFPEGGGVDVPGLLLADATGEADLGMFDGLTDPFLAIVNDAADEYLIANAGGIGVGVKPLSSLDIKTPSADAAGGIILRRSTDNSAFAIYEKSNCLEVAFASSASGADAVGDFTTIWRMAPSGGFDFYEQAAPGAGGTNIARVYAFEGAGDGLTDLCAVFQGGSIDVFAEEATSLDSPRFTTPSGTPMSVKLRKDHPGLVCVVAVFPDGQEMPLKHFEYHDADKVAANVGCDNPLPADWPVETAEEREAKVLAFENGG